MVTIKIYICRMKYAWMHHFHFIRLKLCQNLTGYIFLSFLNQLLRDFFSGPKTSLQFIGNNTANELQWKGAFLGRFNHTACWISKARVQRKRNTLFFFPLNYEFYIFTCHKVKIWGLLYSRTFRPTSSNYHLKHKSSMQAIGSGSGSSSTESPGTEQHIVNFRNATFIFLLMHTEIIKLHGYLSVSILSRSQ